MWLLVLKQEDLRCFEGSGGRCRCKLFRMAEAASLERMVFLPVRRYAHDELELRGRRVAAEFASREYVYLDLAGVYSWRRYLSSAQRMVLPSILWWTRRRRGAAVTLDTSPWAAPLARELCYMELQLCR